MPDVANGMDFESVGGVSATTGRPFVQTKARVKGVTLAVGQLTPEQARSLAMQVLHAADMAIADAALWNWLKDEMELPPAKRAIVLAEQRAHRARFDRQLVDES